MQIFEFTINLLTKEEINKTPEEISLKLKEIMPNSSYSVNNNIPIEISNEVPFLTFNSSDNYIFVSVMKKKISLKFGINDNKIDIDLNAYFKDEYLDSIIKPIFNLFKEYTIVRIWFLPTFFFEDTNWTNTLKWKFFKDDLVVDSDLSIKYNTIDNSFYWFSTNNLNIIQVAEISYWPNINFKKWIVLQKDINNIENSELTFDITKFEDFLIKVLEKITFSHIENQKYY